MINIDFTNIDNAKLIGRLLPFWARGRRISLLLQAILSPLVYVHSKFKAWALEQYIQCHITAQKPSLEWYLKYRLKSHFLNENDSFFISQGINQSISCFSGLVWVNDLHWDNNLYWASDDVVYSEDMESDGNTNVFAPAIVDTLNYSQEDYKRDIRNIMSKFMINFNKINIIINTAK